ncbi:methionine biosynthesis protein MetW [Desulfovibrio inopinatus]|uniref:methionine biosynthesis protein MetW n=1 Tax=Desulfovibrio inopinatus TaxID=102109 RepID=UPI000414C897|nr:methionine biosynthesis protein MetW [Desulfovibrio inopinatus]
MRFDLQVIASWIRPGSRVLDLGCGKGDLLKYLEDHKQVRATGIEYDESKVTKALARGLAVLQGDINQELQDYADLAFDYVILSQTLQQVYNPAPLLSEMLRIASQGIVSFPNFAHWRCRSQLFFEGYAPRTKELPYEWHDTPNIRVITLKDFRRFCRQFGFDILEEAAIKTDYREETGQIISHLSGLRAKYGVFLLGCKTHRPEQKSSLDSPSSI